MATQLTAAEGHLRYAITVKEARKLLGKESKTLTNDQVNEIIMTLTLLARNYIYKSGSKKIHDV